MKSVPMSIILAKIGGRLSKEEKVPMVMAWRVGLPLPLRIKKGDCLSYFDGSRLVTRT